MKKSAALPLTLFAILTAAVMPVAAVSQPAVTAELTENTGVATDAVPEADNIVAMWQADRTVPLDAKDVDLADFQWIARPVFVFADTPNDPLFTEQMELLAIRADEMADRDVVIIFDTDPDARTDVRLQLRPRGFMLALMSKDGTVTARRPRPWDVRELSRAIDRTPTRQQELRDRRGFGQ